jgi:chromosome partitioning protein
MILAFVGQKGGAGKSTLSIFVAAELAAQGRNVLLIDADPQGTARTWHSLAVESGHPAPTVIAVTGATLHRPEQVPKLAASYDDIVIDTPPRLAEVQRSALAVANVALLPCGPSAPDAWAMAESLKAVTEAQGYRPDLVASIVINRKRTGTAAAKGARDALVATGLPVLGTELALRQAYQEAIAAGQGIAAYAPRDPATLELQALVTELSTLGGKKRWVARKSRASG